MWRAEGKWLPKTSRKVRARPGRLPLRSAAPGRAGPGLPAAATTTTTTAARSVLCPVCDSEVTLPPGGIGQLTPDYLALNRSREAAGCDLCADGAAARRCLTCGADLCLFCCQAHR